MQPKPDYTKGAPSMAQPLPVPASNSMPALLVPRALLDDEEAKAKCLMLTGDVEPRSQDPLMPPTIEYSTQQLESKNIAESI